MMRHCILTILVLTLLGGTNLRAQNLYDILTACEVRQHDFTTTIPIEYRHRAVIVPVSIQGKTYRFLLDTGAVCTVSQRLWDLLGLTAKNALPMGDSQGNTIMEAITSGKTKDASEALFTYRQVLPKVVEAFHFCKASDFSAPKTMERYAGVFVFYTLTLPDGTTRQNHLALRKDNEQGIWMLDGGI